LSSISSARKEAAVRDRKAPVIVAAALFSTALSHGAMGQGKATAREVVAKVRQAARTLSKTRDLTPFAQKWGPWVWKDTYVFVVDCDNKVVAAHPIKPELVGQSSASLKDTKENNVFPEDSCDAAKKPSGIWVEYWWPKPGEKQGSRKLSYGLAAKGTPYDVGAGIYDEKATVAELSKLTGTK
jgi:cytochrome c